MEKLVIIVDVEGVHWPNPKKEWHAHEIPDSREEGNYQQLHKAWPNLIPNDGGGVFGIDILATKYMNKRGSDSC